MRECSRGSKAQVERSRSADLRLAIRCSLPCTEPQSYWHRTGLSVLTLEVVVVLVARLQSWPGRYPRFGPDNQPGPDLGAPRIHYCAANCGRSWTGCRRVRRLAPPSGSIMVIPMTGLCRNTARRTTIASRNRQWMTAIGWSLQAPVGGFLPAFLFGDRCCDRSIRGLRLCDSTRLLVDRPNPTNACPKQGVRTAGGHSVASRRRSKLQVFIINQWFAGRGRRKLGLNHAI